MRELSDSDQQVCTFKSQFSGYFRKTQFITYLQSDFDTMFFKKYRMYAISGCKIVLLPQERMTFTIDTRKLSMFHTEAHVIEYRNSFL